MADLHALRPRFHLTEVNAPLGCYTGFSPMTVVRMRYLSRLTNHRYLGARISITTAGSGLVGVTEEEYYDGETAATYYPAKTVWGTAS